MKRWSRWSTQFLLALLASVLLVAGAESSTVAQEMPDSADDAWKSVVIELQTPSAAEVYLTAVANAQEDATAADMNQIAALTAAQVAEVANAQDGFAAALASYGAQEVYRVQRLYNGMAVRLPSSAIETLRADPRVRSIRPLIAKEPDNAQSIPHIGAPTLWSAPNGLTGKGVRIGIIDTGVDYLHVGLGGPGKGYNKNDTTIIGDVPGYPNARVVAGHDFVGDDYNANPSLHPYQPNPRPDPDPMDCYNHGTHVAGSAAGSGVTAAGAEYKGAYSSALDTATMRIGPGVAPEAEIYALKVFGCFGSSEVVDLAIEWAIDPNGDGNFDDHLDVINLSLGSPFGDVNDTTTLAVDRAAQIGVLVASSMGNSGDTWFAAGSPGVATRAVTVGATQVVPDSVQGEGSATDIVTGFTTRGPRRGDNVLKPDITAPGYLVVSVAGGTGNGATSMNGTSMATPMVGGGLALLRQLYPLWNGEEIKALLMSTAMGAVRFDTAYTGVLAPPTRAGAGLLALDDALRSETLAYSPDVAGAVALNFGAPEVFGAYNALRNLRILNHADEARTLVAEYIPVVDLPGVELSFAQPPTITIPAHGNGTIPVMLTADASAIRNVPDPSIETTQSGAPRQWRAEEQGHVWMWNARGVFASALNGAGATPPNASSATAAFSAIYTPATRELSYTLTSTIAPAQVASVSIDRGITGHGSPQLAHMLFVRGNGPNIIFPYTGTVTLETRDAVLLASGYLQVRMATSSGAIAGALIAEEPVLKTPLFAAPKPISAMQANTTTIDVGAAQSITRTFHLTGTPLNGSVFPTDTQSLVSVFELHASSPRLPKLEEVVTPDFADIQYVGVTSDYPRIANKDDARLFFAISTWGEWSTPWQTMFVVSIDVDEDDIPDYWLYSSDKASYLGGRQSSDAFIAVVEDLYDGATVEGDPINFYHADERLTALYQNNVLFLSAPIALLGLSPENGNFRYSVSTYLRSPRPGEYGDEVSGLSFDVRRQGLAINNMTPGSPYQPDRPDRAIGITYNLVNMARSSARGVLLLHHFNGYGSRAEAIPLIYQWPVEINLPLIAVE